MNEHPSSEFERELHETLNAPHANPVFVRDLRETLLERSKMKNRKLSFPRLAWGFTLAVLLALLVVASPRAAATLKQLLGYIPGVGFVESSEALRILSEPVAVEKNGTQVIVEKGTADLQRTTLLLHIEGFVPPNPEIFCYDPARLVLPDGTSLKEVRYEYSSEFYKDSPNGIYSARYEFEALPAGQLEATLEISCLLQNPNHINFTLPLYFKIANADDVVPVIVLPTESTHPADPSTAPAASEDTNIEGFLIVLESEAVLEDGYILTGSYQWTDSRFDGFSVYPFEIQITDANDEQVDFEPVDPGTYNSDPAIKRIPFAFHVIGKNHAFPLKISVGTVTVNLPDTATFQFDAGTDPQVGQSWDANLDIPVAGHVVHVQTIQVIAGRTPTELGFNFAMTGDDGVMGAVIYDADPNIPNMSGGGGGGSGGGGGISSQFQHGWTIEGYSPAGVKTFAITDITVSLDGTWQIEWQPSSQ